VVNRLRQVSAMANNVKNLFIISSLK